MERTVRNAKTQRKELVEYNDAKPFPKVLMHQPGYSLVFTVLIGLATGGDFLLINDHDPVPLRRQMEAIRPGQMAWEYLERGPIDFRIRVRRAAAKNGRKSSENTTPEAQLQEIRGV